jgi:plasmid rolling circle replication initiator protein Rep
MPENTGDELYLSEISPKDKPWDVHRAFADRIQNLYSLNNHARYAERIQHCAKLIGYALAANDEGELAIRLRSAHFCRCRHCSVCQWRRSLKWRAKFFQAMPAIAAAYPTHRWVFLTLTVRNCPLSELRSILSHMNKSFKRLTDLAAWPAIGWVKSVEVTRSEDGEAHPHFHCLLLVPAGYFSGHAYIKQETWRELWQKCLRVEYLPVVHVKAVKPQKTSNPGSVVDEMASAVCEVLKYSVKEQDLVMDSGWLAELTNQLHKTKAIAIGGCLRDLIEDKPETNENLLNPNGEIDGEVDDDVRIWFGWREMIARYAKQ